MKSKVLTMFVIAVFLAFNSGIQAVTIDWVTVGNPGNAADTEIMIDSTTGYGSVSYEYQIGKYEVTAGQYTEFLNAVAATDTYGLYNSNMWSSPYGCKIQQSGSSGSYSYLIASDYANRPVNYVSWYDTLRFCNWLHNGQGTGDTENGAYDMSLGDSVARKAGAQVWLPSEDEWYKAAYHKNDGITGNYFDYSTSSDSFPSNYLVDPDPGNTATFRFFYFTIGNPYYRTEVGAHENSDSPYGTFDMTGNVLEWNEALIDSGRGFRGGSFNSNGEYYLNSSYRYGGDPNLDSLFCGFRVASVPEPASLVLLFLGGLVLRKRRQCHNV